jgi:hypothetical protein
MTAFWDIALYSFVEVDQCFRIVYCFHHQRDNDEGSTTPLKRQSTSTRLAPRNASDICLLVQTLLQVSLKHILIGVTSCRGIPNSMRMLYNTSLLTESGFLEIYR